MTFRGRTVFAFILLSLFAGSIVTLTVVSSLDSVSAMIGLETAGVKPGKEDPPKDATKRPGTELSAAEINKLNTAITLIESKYIQSLERKELLDGAISGMVGVLKDPYTVYMDKDETQSFTSSVDSTFTGIGAEVMLKDGAVTVVSPIKGSPAERAGIHANDVIISVNGESLAGLKLNDAVQKIRGPKGTQAKLQILRSGSTEPIEIIVVRDDIDIETVFSEMLEGNIGKIELRQFAQNTTKRFMEDLADLEQRQMKGLIIDVRNNPGGYLDGVIDILNPLVPKGKTLVQIEYRGEEPKKVDSEGPGKSYPIVVLTNKGSASASEILAAALKQNGAGAVIGETTYGKGTVQVPFDHAFADGSSIKMTVAKWLTPNGDWINEQGVEPDQAVEQPAYYKAAPLTKERVLKQDGAGEEVKNLQLMLDGLGLAPGRTDGYFSKQTELAVKAFQRLHGLDVNGQVDEATSSKLEEAVIKEIMNPANDKQLNAAIEWLQKRM